MLVLSHSIQHLAAYLGTTPVLLQKETLLYHSVQARAGPRQQTCQGYRGAPAMLETNFDQVRPN